MKEAIKNLKYYPCGYCDNILTVNSTDAVKAYHCWQCDTWSGLNVDDDGLVLGLYPIIQESIDKNDE